MNGLSFIFTLVPGTAHYIASCEWSGTTYVSEETSISPLKSADKLVALPKKVDYLPEVDRIQLVYAVEIIEEVIHFTLKPEAVSLEEQVRRQRIEIEALRAELDALRAPPKEPTRMFIVSGRQGQRKLTVFSDLSARQQQFSAEANITCIYWNRRKQDKAEVKFNYEFQHHTGVEGIKAYLLRIQKEFNALAIEVIISWHRESNSGCDITLKCVDIAPPSKYVLYGSKSVSVIVNKQPYIFYYN